MSVPPSTVFADTDKDGVLDEGEAFARYTSEKGLLKKVENNNNVYNFSYDIYGNRRATSVGNTTLINYLFNDNNGKLNSVVYGNGATVTYTYDKLNRVREINKGNRDKGTVLLSPCPRGKTATARPLSVRAGAIKTQGKHKGTVPQTQGDGSSGRQGDGSFVCAECAAPAS